jgi:hypothetical protein
MQQDAAATIQIGFHLCFPAGSLIRRAKVNEEPENKTPEVKQKYRWPWFVLAAFVLAIGLAILWMSKEIARTRRNRDFTLPARQTGSNSAPGSAKLRERA